jgi:hypothetical protein
VITYGNDDDATSISNNSESSPVVHAPPHLGHTPGWRCTQTRCYASRSLWASPNATTSSSMRPPAWGRDGRLQLGDGKEKFLGVGAWSTPCA